MPTTEPTFPVKFSQAQRRAIAGLLPDLTDRLEIDTKNQRVIQFTINEIRDIHDRAEVMVSQAESGMVRNSLRHIADITTEASENAGGIGRIPASQRIYQIRISLNDIEPDIWRRIQVRDCTFDRLHEHIQTAMGWTNSHLHQFDINDVRYGDPELLDDGFDDFECQDSSVIKLSQILPKDGKRFQFLYEYDFGDGWEHNVLFEGCLKATKGKRYPVRVEGARHCPPEDVGGTSGYAEFLDALANPKHERHEELSQWGGPFDSEDLDAVKMTREMRRGIFDWRNSPEVF